jgi:hypothetical protein
MEISRNATSEPDLDTLALLPPSNSLAYVIFKEILVPHTRLVLGASHGWPSFCTTVKFEASQ